MENFFKFAQFTLTLEDAQEYAYSISPTKRVRNWRDIEVNPIFKMNSPSSNRWGVFVCDKFSFYV